MRERMLTKGKKLKYLNNNVLLKERKTKVGEDKEHRLKIFIRCDNVIGVPVLSVVTHIKFIDYFESNNILFKNDHKVKCYFVNVKSIHRR